jgi:hypothetical protein
VFIKIEPKHVYTPILYLRRVVVVLRRVVVRFFLICLDLDLRLSLFFVRLPPTVGFTHTVTGGSVLVGGL